MSFLEQDLGKFAGWPIARSWSILSDFKAFFPDGPFELQRSQTRQKSTPMRPRALASGKNSMPSRSLELRAVARPLHPLIFIFRAGVKGAAECASWVY